MPVKPSDDLAGIDRAVASAAKNGTVVEQSVMRDGDRVFLGIELSDQQADMYLRVSCSATEAEWLYADMPVEKAKGSPRERRYASGSTAYASPLALGAETAAALRKLPEVQEACGRPAGWREVLYNKRSDTQVLLDVSSLQQLSDGTVRFWSGVDYPYIAFIRVYKAPYARRTGLFQADCLRRTYSLLHVYYLDQRQTVTDGGMAKRPPRLSFNQASGDYATVLTTVCEQREMLKSLVPPEAREKRFPDFATVPPVNSAVVNQVANLKLKTPRRELSAMRIEGLRTPRGGSVAAQLNHNGAFLQDVTVERTQTPGIFRIVRNEDGDQTEEFSFLGMVPLSQSFNSAGAQNTALVDRLELRGDWVKMPVDSQLGWRQRTRIVDVVTNQSTREAEVLCKVVRPLPAAELSPQLSGGAKELICHDLAASDDEISTYYYLEEYGYVYPQSSITSRFNTKTRLSQLR
ncbi:MAG: hypothetical protein LBR05_10350 [Azoarcus sp.]|nr:hypothetical protein [Azoarcus sp.]